MDHIIKNLSNEELLEMNNLVINEMLSRAGMSDKAGTNGIMCIRPASLGDVLSGIFGGIIPDQFNTVRSV